MASGIFNRGLQQVASKAAGIGAVPAIQTMSVDDRSTAFVFTTDTTLGNPTNVFKAAFDATPVLTGQTVRYVMTVPAASFNAAPIRRIVVHNDTAANVSPTSATVIAGTDGQSFQKSASFGVTISVDILYTSV